MFDFNHGARRSVDDERASPISDRINTFIDAAMAREEAERPTRQYVGASAIGKNCERSIQLDYIHSNELGIEYDPKPFEPKILRIFKLGHLFEDILVDLLRSSGFDMKVKKQDGRQFGFSVLKDRFRGHVDGIVYDGPVPLAYPCLWEAKSLNNKSWRDVVKKGVALSKPIYAAQIAVNQAYLELQNPCLFTAINKDNAEIYHEMVEFDAKLAQDSSDKAVRIIKATETGRLLPRSYADPSHFSCRFCRWQVPCWEKLPAK